MKRILTLLLVLALTVAALASCDVIEKIPGLGDLVGGKECTEHVDADGNYVCDNCEAELEKPHVHTWVDATCTSPKKCSECGETEGDPIAHTYGENGSCSCGALDPEYEALLDASAYVRQLYKDEPTYTTENLTLVAKVTIGDITFPVVWTASTDKVTITASPDGSSVIVEVPEVTEDTYEETPYTLTATITSEKGYVATREFDRKLPKFQVNTWEDYANAKEGDLLIVEGIVVLINSKSAGNTRNNLFVMDATGVGGYYNYNMTNDPIADLGIQVGMTVRISGEASPYNGLPEFYDASVKVIDETIKTFDYIDITEKWTKNTNYNHLVALPVVIKGVTLGDQDLSEKSQYMKFSLNGVESYVRTYVTDFPAGILDADDKATIDAFHLANYGNKADVYGIMITYSNNPYIIPVSVECFTNIQAPERTDEQKLALELEKLTLVEAVAENSVITLPTAGSSYDTVKFAWESDNACAVVSEGKLTVTLPSEKTTVKVTVTATIGELSDTKTFEIAVDGAASDLYVPKAENAPVAGTAYKFYLVQVTLGKNLYLTGEVSGRYLVTTDKAEQAVDVYVETVDGGVKFYILDGETKLYITVYNNDESKLSVKYDAAGTSVYTYNETVNAWVTNFDGTDYYLGTYSNYNTVSASKLSYISAENTGVSQFPAGFATLAPAALDAEAVTAPVAGTAYKFYLVQVTLGKNLYLTGEVSGRYLVTTDKISKAVDVYVETVEGGVKFYILDGETKLYITVYNNDESKLSVKYDAAGTSVYTYNETVNAWVTNFDGTDYYLGTYSNYNTVSASKLSYISAENTGVSQFPAGFATIEFVVEEDEQPSEPDVPACNHVDANNDYKCDNTDCAELILPAADSVLTIEEALKITALYVSNDWSGHYSTNKYYVSGTVLSVVDASKGNLVIVDANGNELPLNTLKNADGTVAYSEMTNKPIKGDTITVYGVIGAYGQNIQLYEGWTTAHTAHEHVNASATCTVGSKCSVCGTITGSGTGHIDADSNNVCDAANCGVVLNVTAESLDVFASAGVLSSDSLSISWTSTNFTCVGEKAKSSSAIRTSDADHYRIYANSNFTISAADGKKISKVVLTVTEAKYASILAQSLTTAGASATYDGTVVTVTIDLGTLEAISFTASAQTRVAKVDVYCQ